MVKPPFRITSQTGLGRGVDGRFQKLVSNAAPPQVIQETTTNGIPLNEAVRAASVPDRLVGSGQAKNVAGPRAMAPAPVYPDALPWPVADNGRKPFKL